MACSWSTLSTYVGLGCQLRRPLLTPLQPPRGKRHLVISAAQRTGERESWDLRRFFRTVLYFNPPPSVSTVISSLRPDNLFRSFVPKDVKHDMSHLARDWVLVTNAAGDIGQSIMQKLQQKGLKARALDSKSSAPHTKMEAELREVSATLGTSAADAVQPPMIHPGVLQGVQAVIVAPSSSGGDDVRSIHNLLQAANETLAPSQPRVIFDPAEEASRLQWGALDDVVMGGVSESRLEAREGAGEDGSTAAVFSGRVSAANNGGFASVRTRNFDPPLDLSAYEALQLRVKGDGQRYKVTIRTDTGWDSVGYTKSFDTRAGEWQDVQLQFAEFVPVFRAKTVPNGPILDASSIYSIQLMLSKFEYDGVLNPAFRLGDFSLPIATISAVPAESELPKLVFITSPGESSVQREAEDMVRESGVPFAIARLEAPAAVNGTTAFNSGDIAELAIDLLRQPCALNRTLEVRITDPFTEIQQVAPKHQVRSVDWAALVKQAIERPGVAAATVRGSYTVKALEQ